MKNKELLDKFIYNAYVILTDKSLENLITAINGIEKVRGNYIDKYSLNYDDDVNEHYIIIDYYTNDTEWYAGRVFVRIDTTN